jgi:glutamate synthase domain-containing protein 2
VRFITWMRELSGGKPAGFKLCVGSRVDVLAICKAMLVEGTAPDFVIVDGSEGGTGAAPLEFEDHVGRPLTEGLIMVHNALVGTGLRDRVKIGASGKVASGSDIVKRLIQGADYTNAARAMMMATGCIQSQRCHTNQCPVGVATQDPKRAQALDVVDKSLRVQRFQRATVAEAGEIMAAMGARRPDELRHDQLIRRVRHHDADSYAELYDWLSPGELIDGEPSAWAADWDRADPNQFVR